MLNLIVAPYDCCENGEIYTKRIVKYLKEQNVEYSVYFCATLDDVTKNAEEIYSLGETEFVIVGDDNIISTFLNSIKDIGKIKLGIVPTSKHDDFASFIGLSANPIQAIKDILEREIETVDYLICNDKVVLNNISIGSSAEVFEIFNKYKVRNGVTFKYALMKYGNKFDGVELTLDSKSTKQKTENIFELSIANGGNRKGKNLSPLSNVKDGLFNLNYSTTSEDRKTRKKYLKSTLMGKHIYDDNTKQHWLTSLKITNADKRIRAVLDGNLQTFEEMNVSIVENGLKLYKKIN